MVLPRSKKRLCYLIIIAVLFVIFRRFSEPESILEDNDDMLDSPPSNHPRQLTVVDFSDDDWDSELLVPERKSHSVPKKPLPPALGKHKFRSDGLLQVNMQGAHPIFELISLAEKEWEAKLRGASKTFREAVQEYRRRYKRAPPKGFDLWWKYATEHNVQLPDEYDQIYRDLEPFWGIEPADLIEIHEENELQEDTYTIGHDENGHVDILTYAFGPGKYDQLIVGTRKILEMFKDIEQYLPPFRMTISPHDSPTRLSDYRMKQAALEAAASHRYIDRALLPRPANLGWLSACPPNSPARRKPLNLDNPPPPPTEKTFITNHLLSMDPCNHPNLFYHHGQFLAHYEGPPPQPVLVPEFSYCSTTLHHNIRIPVPYLWVEDIYPRSYDPEWDRKFDERLLWRGSNTGIFQSEKSRWRDSQRNFLVEFANDFKGILDVLPPDRFQNEQLVEMREMMKSRINPAVMDIAFGGEPILCTPDVCDILKEDYQWRERQSDKEAGNYKYVIDVDGNGWSGRFKRLITSNSLVFKSTIYPEWFVDRIVPWVHYVPIQVDLSDLHDALLFFRGDANGDGAHEYLARRIASAGRQWSKEFWREEDLVSYFFRLTLEYARLMSLDRDSMSYYG